MPTRSECVLILIYPTYIHTYIHREYGREREAWARHVEEMMSSSSTLPPGRKVRIHIHTYLHTRHTYVDTHIYLFVHPYSTAALRLVGASHLMHLLLLVVFIHPSISFWPMEVLGPVLFVMIVDD